MTKGIAYVEVVFCMTCYLRDVAKWADEEYFETRKAEILEAGKEVLDSMSYKTLVHMIKDMEVMKDA